MRLYPTLFFPILFALAFNAHAAVLADTTANYGLETVQDWRKSMPIASKPIAQAKAQAKVQAKNSRLALSSDIQFEVEELHGTLNPAEAGTPISLENTSAFQVQISHARLRISEAVLQKLVQTELAASDAPIRIKRVNALPGGVQIAGDIRRLGLWIPFEMNGTPTVANSREITLTPSSLKVAGVPVYKALLASSIELESLIDMKSTAVALQGQALVLRLDQLLQAPKISFALNTLELGQGEVKLSFGNASPPAFFCGTRCPGNFVYTEGGELRAAGMVLSGQPTLVTGVTSRNLPIALHDLDGLIRSSTMQLRADGAIWISAQEGRLPENEAALLLAGEKAMNQLEGQIGLSGQQHGAEQATPQQPVTLAVHQATLMSREGVELRVEKLLASTHSTDLGQLPTAMQTVHSGEIMLSESALNMLMNKSLFAYKGSPIRQVKSTIGTQLLELDLQARPEILGIHLLWLPVQLAGELGISRDQLNLEFTPTAVRMFGVSVLPLMDFLGLKLDSLIHIDQPAVKLAGNTIQIALNKALPPLQLNTRLLGIQQQAGSMQGALLQVKVGMQPQKNLAEIEDAVGSLPAGLWMNTPEFTALGMRTGPTLGHVYKAPRTERLVIDLAQYPDLLSEATIRLPEKERVWVSMPGRP